MTTLNINPTNDGYVRYDLTNCDPCNPEFGYIDFNFLPWIWASIRLGTYVVPPDPTPVDYTLGRRGYAFFDTSSLPGGITITKVEINLYTSGQIAISSLDTIFYKETLQYSGFADAEDLYNGLNASATIYAQGLYNTTLYGLSTVDLGAQAVTDLISHPTWFGLGVLIDESAPSTEQSKSYYSENADELSGPRRPFLTVTYTLGGNTNFLIMFE